MLRRNHARLRPSPPAAHREDQFDRGAAGLFHLRSRARRDRQRPPRRHDARLSRKLHRVVRKDAVADAYLLRNRLQLHQGQRHGAHARPDDRPHDHGQGPRRRLHLRRTAPPEPRGPRRQSHALQDSAPEGCAGVGQGQGGLQLRQQVHQHQRRERRGAPREVSTTISGSSGPAASGPCTTTSC